jgi:hypothetical protein
MPKKFKKDSAWFPYMAYISKSNETHLDVVDFNNVKTIKKQIK